MYTYSGEGQAKKNADIGVMSRNLQTKECQRLQANIRNKERNKNTDYLSEASEVANL